MIRHSAIAVYFAIRVLSALVLLKLSTAFLPVEQFANFAQFLAFSSLLNMAVVAGAQNGLIREAAAANDQKLVDVHAAGLAIWLAAIPLLGIPVALFSAQISDVLTGTSTYWQVVIALALLSLAAAPGQVSCNLLSGRRRVVQSLGSQSFGIILGTAVSAWFIIHRNLVGAALAFAAGPVAAMFIALPLAATLPITWKPKWSGVRPLLGYSAAMASTLGFSAIVLFALRSIYRDQFGATQLGYWLAANRISDMSTQFVGLFMLQAFMPHLATAATDEERSRLIIRYGALGAAVTAAALLLFTAASRLWVHLFLSDAYLAAIPAIKLYMLGDFLRVWGSLAMFTAFAAGRPGRYAAIEIATMSVMAALTLLLVAAGEVQAPQIAYAAAWGATALLCAAALFLRHRARLQPRGGRRTPLQGSAPRAL